MRNLLYIIAVLLLLSWVIGFFLYSLGAIVNVLLIIAIVALLIGMAQKRNKRIK